MRIGRERLSSESFSREHRADESSFSRRRKLGFVNVALTLLRRSVRSLQIVLNEFSRKGEIAPVTASAFSQARKKLKHTAFIELLRDCLIEPFYRDGDYEKFKGRRILAIDGSALRLPNTEEIRKAYGRVVDRNRYRTSSHTESKCSVLYDVLNRIPLDGVMKRGRSNDAKVAASHIPYLEAGDVAVCDRGYASFWFFARISKRKADFVVRCPRRRFKNGAGLFADTGDCNSKVVTLSRPSSQPPDGLELPQELTVRFVKVILPTGEVEVLITSLLEDSQFSVDDLSEIYRLRWGIETFYYTLKSRLCLEHFTGKTVETVKQDFYSTLYLSALESVLTLDAKETLATKKTDLPQKVNQAISFSVLKDRAFDLIFNNSISTSAASQQLTELFLQNPTLYQRHRSSPRQRRKESAYWASLHFHKNLKKHVF